VPNRCSYAKRPFYFYGIPLGQTSDTERTSDFFCPNLISYELLNSGLRGRPDELATKTVSSRAPDCQVNIAGPLCAAATTGDFRKAGSRATRQRTLAILI
jgi:hypothetical protein